MNAIRRSARAVALVSSILLAGGYVYLRSGGRLPFATAAQAEGPGQATAGPGAAAVQPARSEVLSGTKSRMVDGYWESTASRLGISVEEARALSTGSPRAKDVRPKRTARAAKASTQSRVAREQHGEQRPATAATANSPPVQAQRRELLPGSKSAAIEVPAEPTVPTAATPARTTPPPAPPRREVFAGSKSMRVTLPPSAPPAAQQAAERYVPARAVTRRVAPPVKPKKSASRIFESETAGPPRRMLMPGSKSAEIALPSEVDQQQQQATRNSTAR